MIPILALTIKALIILNMLQVAYFDYMYMYIPKNLIMSLYLCFGMRHVVCGIPPNLLSIMYGVILLIILDSFEYMVQKGDLVMIMIGISQVPIELIDYFMCLFTLFVLFHAIVYKFIYQYNVMPLAPSIFLATSFFI